MQKPGDVSGKSKVPQQDRERRSGGRALTLTHSFAEASVTTAFLSKGISNIREDTLYTTLLSLCSSFATQRCSGRTHLLRDELLKLVELFVITSCLRQEWRRSTITLVEPIVFREGASHLSSCPRSQLASPSTRQASLQHSWRMGSRSLRWWLE